MYAVKTVPHPCVRGAEKSAELQVRFRARCQCPQSTQPRLWRPSYQRPLWVGRLSRRDGRREAKPTELSGRLCLLAVTLSAESFRRSVATLRFLRVQIWTPARPTQLL